MVVRTDRHMPPTPFGKRRASIKKTPFHPRHMSVMNNMHIGSKKNGGQSIKVARTVQYRYVDKNITILGNGSIPFQKAF